MISHLSESCLANVFADDTEIEHVYKSEQCKIEFENTLIMIYINFDSNYLTINVVKCEFLQIGTYQALNK